MLPLKTGFSVIELHTIQCSSRHALALVLMAVQLLSGRYDHKLE